MNLSERLAKAAEDRRKEHEAARRIHFDTGSLAPGATIEFDPTASSLPDAVALPDTDELTSEPGPLPIWERPLGDLLDAPLATVTALPIVPRDDVRDDVDDDDDEVARTIPMRGARIPTEVEIDLDGLYVPPLAAAESDVLARIVLRSEPSHGRTEYDDVVDLTEDDASDAAEQRCPQCGGPARIDIHDPMRGRIHLSCDACYKMWQTKVESTVDLDEPYMRD